MTTDYVVGYGALLEVARFHDCSGNGYRRGQRVVVRTNRGEEAGEVLGEAAGKPPEGGPQANPSAEHWQLLRPLGQEEQQRLERHRARSREEFDQWSERLARMKLPAELIDMEYLLDGETVVLYVLADESANLAGLSQTLSRLSSVRLQFQPVGPDGKPVAPTGGGGCGSCSCSTRKTVPAS